MASNRDEFYTRPTADAHFWDDHNHVLAGRDLQAGGTWMGVNLHGSIAMLTNYRDLSNLKADAPSRGELVSDYLIDNFRQPKPYDQRLLNEGQKYNGFNLMYGTADQLSYYSNITNEITSLSRGFYGLSNHLLNSSWPKVEAGKNKLQSILQSENLDPEELFEALYDDIKAPDHLLPDTGVGLEMERMLSPMFIKSAGYGSRCSTVVLVNRNNEWTFTERIYDTNNFSFKTQKFRFSESNQ